MMVEGGTYSSPEFLTTSLGASKWTLARGCEMARDSFQSSARLRML